MMFLLSEFWMNLYSEKIENQMQSLKLLSSSLVIRWFWQMPLVPLL